MRTGCREFHLPKVRRKKILSIFPSHVWGQIGTFHSTAWVAYVVYNGGSQWRVAMEVDFSSNLADFFQTLSSLPRDPFVPFHVFFSPDKDGARGFPR